MLTSSHLRGKIVVWITKVWECQKSCKIIKLPKVHKADCADNNMHLLYTKWTVISKDLYILYMMWCEQLPSHFPQQFLCGKFWNIFAKIWKIYIKLCKFFILIDQWLLHLSKSFLIFLFTALYVGKHCFVYITQCVPCLQSDI